MRVCEVWVCEVRVCEVRVCEVRVDTEALMVSLPAVGCAGERSAL